TDYHVSLYSQIPGNFERSRNNLFPFENAIRNPKYALTLTYFQPALQMGFALLWGVAFKFDARREYMNHFSPIVSALNYQLQIRTFLYDKIEKNINTTERGSREWVKILNTRKSNLNDI